MCIAIPGKIISISGDESLLRKAEVDFGGLTREVNLALLPEAQIGDYVLVHVGFALSIIDQKEADEIFRELKLLEEAENDSQSRESTPDDAL